MRGNPVVTIARITRVYGKSGESVNCPELQRAQNRREGTHLLASTVRTPNTDGNWPGTGRSGNDRPRLREVKNSLKANCADVWSVGDVRVQPHFTHSAFDDFSASCAIISSAADRLTTVNACAVLHVHDRPSSPRLGLAKTMRTRRGICLSNSPKSLSFFFAVLRRPERFPRPRGFMKALSKQRSITSLASPLRSRGRKIQAVRCKSL